MIEEQHDICVHIDIDLQELPGKRMSLKIFTYSFFGDAGAPAYAVRGTGLGAVRRWNYSIYPVCLGLPAFNRFTLRSSWIGGWVGVSSVGIEPRRKCS